MVLVIDVSTTLDMTANQFNDQIKQEIEAKYEKYGFVVQFNIH